MALAQAVDSGLLPDDPDQPWSNPALEHTVTEDLIEDDRDKRERVGLCRLCPMTRSKGLYCKDHWGTSGAAKDTKENKS
jgi:hypothetical protein